MKQTLLGQEGAQGSFMPGVKLPGASYAFLAQNLPATRQALVSRASGITSDQHSTQSV